MSRALTMVRVRNDSDTPYADMYASTRFTVPARGEAFIPWDAVCLWLGDPSLVDRGDSPMLRDRTNELHRVQVRCGYNDGQIVNAEGFDVAADWDDHRPKLTVFTMEGTEVHMVADAPDGTPQDLTGADGVKSTIDRISDLEATIAALKAGSVDALSAPTHTPEAPPVDEMPPPDKPAKTPVRVG